MKAKNKSDFLNRHVGLNDSDIKKMLKRLNIKSLDHLIEKVIPKNILSPITENLLEKDLSETETLVRLKKYSKKNKQKNKSNFYSTSFWFVCRCKSYKKKNIKRNNCI